MGNPQKGLTIPVWFKKLRSMLVGKISVICGYRDTLLDKKLNCGRPLLIKFHGLHSRKSMNHFDMTIICK